MRRLGLALSGGGFRATLYHLGVVRFLRDAKLLDSVTHITSVSGGSVLAAHLVLNWDRYCAHVAHLLTQAVAETRADYSMLLSLLENGPVSSIEPMEYIEVAHLDPLLGEAGMDIISDTRIIDLREWFTAGGSVPKNRHLYSYRHVMIRKTAESKDSTGLRLQSLWNLPELTVRCLNPELSPVLCRCSEAASPSGDGPYSWDLRLDFSSIAVGQTVAVIVEVMVPYDSVKPEHRSRDWWRFEVDANPEVATSWILLPEGSQYANMSLVRYDNTQPDVEERIEPTHQAIVRGGSIINWSVVHPQLGYTYSCRWSWKM